MRAALAVLFGLLLVGALAGLIERAARWLVRQWPIILVVAMALVLAGCAVGRAAAYHHYAGFAIWDCDRPDPVAFVRLDFMGDSSVIRHEQAHLRQMRDTGCALWHAQMQRKAFRDSIEADAWVQAWAR